MELAWQKERESQKKLIAELNTMGKDLKVTGLVIHPTPPHSPTLFCVCARSGNPDGG